MDQGTYNSAVLLWLLRLVGCTCSWGQNEKRKEGRMLQPKLEEKAADRMTRRGGGVRERGKQLQCSGSQTHLVGRSEERKAIVSLVFCHILCTGGRVQARSDSYANVLKSILMCLNLSEHFPHVRNIGTW